MIPFERILPQRKAEYDRYLMSSGKKGCEYSFVNLFLWGRQTAAVLDGNLVLFSHFNGNSIYPFPAGPGDRKTAVDAVIADSLERKIPCRLTSLDQEDVRWLQDTYPGKFRYCFDRADFDYVYAIDDLADLRGRKYQQKRNHLHRFEEAYPGWHVKQLDDSTLATAKNLIDNWFFRHRSEESDSQMEQVALRRAFANFHELELEGLILFAGDTPAAVTMGSRLDKETFDIHFEKAVEEIPEAYGAVNREFARYLREKHPELRYLNREDDVGLPGLRKAKLSYHPAYLIEKSWAYLAEEEYDD